MASARPRNPDIQAQPDLPRLWPMGYCSPQALRLRKSLLCFFCTPCLLQCYSQIRSQVRIVGSELHSARECFARLGVAYQSEECRCEIGLGLEILRIILQ